MVSAMSAWPQQHLDGAQVGAGFQHVSREAVSKQMRGNTISDASPLTRLVHRLPHDLRSDGYICPPVVHRTRKQIGLGPHPTPVLTQSLQQLGAQQNIPVAAALALVDMNDHALAIDIGDLEMAQFRAAYAGCLKRHHHGAAHQVLGCIDQPLHLFWTKYSGQLPGALRKGDMFGEIRSSQRLDVEKAQGRNIRSDRSRLKLAITKPMSLILPDMVSPQTIR